MTGSWKKGRSLMGAHGCFLRVIKISVKQAYRGASSRQMMGRTEASQYAF